jgi:uncharacterized repeat protein (TIGR01451 family)
MSVDVEQLDSRAWTGGAMLALVGVGLGIGSPLLVAAAAVPLAYLVAAAFASDPPATVQVHRRFSTPGLVADGAGTISVEAESGTAESDAESGTARADTGTASADDEFDAVAAGGDVWYGSPGDVVTVRTTVRNTGTEAILDLRLVDGVPGDLPVVDGTTRTCVTLAPGERTTVEYDVELVRGEHSFASPAVRVRDHTGTSARTWSPDVAGDARIDCSPAVDQVPLDEGRDDYTGEVPTEEGGTGIEFHSVREYEPGDPVRSIDWRRYANSRDLATVEYRAERSTRVVCLVDARESQFRDSPGATPTAVDLSLDAAERTAQTLASAGHPTSLVGLHSEQLTSVPPGTGATTRRRIGQLVTEIRESGKNEILSNWVLEGSYRRVKTDDPVERLPGTLPGDALVYLFSSFVDDESTELVEVLRSYGYTVRVVSPDIIGETDEVPTRLAALARERRLADARATGAEVVDWPLDRSLDLLFEELVEVQR